MFQHSRLSKSACGLVTDIILVAGLILLETLAVRKYLKRKSHTAIKVETDKQNMDA